MKILTGIVGLIWFGQIAFAQEFVAGIYVQDADSGQVLYQHNESKYFVPSSVAKLVIDATALMHFGADYSFVTTLYFNNTHDNKTIHGVVLKASGDPSLTRSDLAELFQRLKATHRVQQIQGDLIVDNSLFDESHFAPGWMMEDLGWYYSAPLTALVIDENRFKVTLKSKKDVVDLQVDAYLPVKVSTNFSTNVDKSNEFSLKFFDDNRYLLHGNMAPLSTKNLYLSVINPDRFIKDTVKALLDQYDIKLAGKVKVTYRPQNLSGKQHISHQSEPLVAILKRMQFDSKNILSDAIMKYLGANYYNSTGTWSKGVKAMSAISQQHFATTPLKLVDASGLSRYNLLAPKQLGALLYTMYQHPTLSQQFLSTLPLAGQEGWTFAHRMKEKIFQGLVLAKTGNMKGASGIAGYVKTSKGMRIVVILINNYTQAQSRIYKWQDNIIEKVIRHAPASDIHAFVKS